MNYKQLGAFIIALVGLLGTILICALPMWTVSAYVGANVITAQIYWEGLWTSCVLQSTGETQCLPYESVLALPQSLQASRALVCASMAASVIAVALHIVGGDCTNFYRYNRRMKVQVEVAAGVVFMLAGVMCLVAVSWSAAEIIQGFYSTENNPAPSGELGAAIYIGWVTGVLLLIGGGMLCCSHKC